MNLKESEGRNTGVSGRDGNIMQTLYSFTKFSKIEI